MSEQLRNWIVEQLEGRKWSYRALAKEIDMSHVLVSKVISGDMKPSADFCIKVAYALEEPPEKLLRMAEILPPGPTSDDAALQELLDLARNLSPEDRQELLNFARFRYKQEQKKD